MARNLSRTDGDYYFLNSPFIIVIFLFKLWLFEWIGSYWSPQGTCTLESRRGSGYKKSSGMFLQPPHHQHEATHQEHTKSTSVGQDKAGTSVLPRREQRLGRKRVKDYEKKKETAFWRSLFIDCLHFLRAWMRSLTMSLLSRAKGEDTGDEEQNKKAGKSPAGVTPITLFSSLGSYKLVPPGFKKTSGKVNYPNWLCWKISAQTVTAVTIGVSWECCRAIDSQLGQIPLPSHPTLSIDAVRANSAFHAQGPLPRGTYLIILAWQLQADVHRAEEGILGLTQWDGALLGILSEPQLREAVDVILDRPKPSYPPVKPGGKAFSSHARNDGSLPAKSDNSYLWCALPPVFSFMNQCGSSLLSHNSENTRSSIFLPPLPETKGEAGQEYDLYDFTWKCAGTDHQICWFQLPL